ncbi:MAG: hypothetical protein JWL96_831, partial [Sphingomonas bacterium]|nr:hypothetical protein [Sphingomonas bacterium]
MGEEGCEESIVPSSAFDFGFDGAFVWVEAERVERHFP